MIILSNFLKNVKLILLFLIVSSNLNAVSLDEKIGKLFVVPICPSHGPEHIEKARKLIKEKHIGSVIFMAGTSQQQLDIIQAINSERDKEIVVFQDAEWGPAMRLKDYEPLPKNDVLGQIKDMKQLEAFGRKLARQCHEVGVHSPLAPVVDINTNPDNIVIGKRSLGSDVSKVTGQALAIVKGMREGGVIACAKHFPGHGDTATDSHKSLPIIQSLQLEPYYALIEEGIPMIMVGHLAYPKLYEGPASLSYVAMTELLREEMGFQGVIITDALNMGALQDFGDTYVKSLLAGANLLLATDANLEVVDDLITRQIPDAIDRIKSVVPESIINERYMRIINTFKIGE